MAARYHAPPGLRLVALDTLSALYHRASGQTHVVAPPVPEMLAILAEAPMTAAEMRAALAERYDVADPDPDAIAARLDELAAIGVVEKR